MADKHRVALVTGGMGGLGEAICIKLAALGLHGRHHATRRATPRRTSGCRDEAAGLQLPARTVRRRRLGSPRRCVKKVRAKSGPVDVLVNNAGITRDMTFKKMDKANWDAVIEDQPRLVLQHDEAGVRRHGRRGWGASSTSRRSTAEGRVRADQLLGGEGRHARLHQGARARIARKGVTSNTISPGYIGTKMVMAIPKEVLDSKIIPQIPMGRLGKPEEVAGLVAYLRARKRRSSPAPTSRSTAASTCSEPAGREARRSRE
jgi:acetoacetyl-CoA reductase